MAAKTPPKPKPRPKTRQFVAVILSGNEQDLRTVKTGDDLQALFVKCHADCTRDSCRADFDKRKEAALKWISENPKPGHCLWLTERIFIVSCGLCVDPMVQDVNITHPPVADVYEISIEPSVAVPKVEEDEDEDEEP